MAKLSRPTLQTRVSERAHGNCSPGYVWLRLAYRRLRKRMAVRYPPYAEVAAEMNEAGVRGGRGALLTDRAVERMWKRVTRDVEADARLRAPRGPGVPAGWMPALFAPPPTTMPQGGTSPVRASPTQQAAEVQLDDVETRIATARREVAERSGR